ncbi:MAG: thiamine pyrophosphate-dependent dehydrogenase E1 component subunit alpha [Magnetococcales bacterium]|nr:thiamine pyrophosphate-dependent dehydrogenase E1 component subunit alpha [Magnetococcales bacterium]
MHERLFRAIYRIRRVEEEVARIYPSDQIKSPIHLSIGQEAPSVAVCDLLTREDVVFGNYRGHALYLARGGDLQAMMAELYGKVDGCARGKGGSMHLIDPRVNMMGTSAIVATQLPHAVGYAWAMAQQKRNGIVACFFGDGATEEGAFHESLNFALLKKLPILFVCENNGCAILSPIGNRSTQINITRRISGTGISSARVESGNVLEIRSAAQTALHQVRQREGGPFFLEILTCRLRGHVGPEEDWDLGYRSHEEVRSFLDNDPVQQMERTIEPARRQEIADAVEQEIQQAIRYARESPFPAPEELYQHVFK